MKPETLETRLLNRIERKRGDVFLRADFEDLGGYDQVGRALRTLIRKRQLVKVGQGLYARARTSSIDGEAVPAKGLATLNEALQRVGVETVPTITPLVTPEEMDQAVEKSGTLAVPGRA